MKNLILVAIFLQLLVSPLMSQSEFGIKFGVSSYDLPTEVLSLDNQDLKLQVENANYGIHFGAYFRFGLLGIKLQPELNFNSNSVEYRVTDFESSNTIDEIRKESYQNIDIPVLVMLTPSFFRLYAGPVGHYFLHSNSELTSIEGLKEEFKTISYGFQVGGGIQIAGITLDLRYEGNFDKFGDHILVDDIPFEFSDTPSRIMLSLGIRL